MLSRYASKHSPASIPVVEESTPEAAGGRHVQPLADPALASPTLASPALANPTLANPTLASPTLARSNPPYEAFVNKEYMLWKRVAAGRRRLPGSSPGSTRRPRLEACRATARPGAGNSLEIIYEEAVADSIRNIAGISVTGFLRDEYRHVPGFRVAKFRYNARTQKLHAVLGCDNVKALCAAQVRDRLKTKLNEFPEVYQSALKIYLRITPNPHNDKTGGKPGSEKTANPLLEETRKQLLETLVERFCHTTLNPGRPDGGNGDSRDMPMKELVRIRLDVDGDTLICNFSPRRLFTGHQRCQIDLLVGKLKAGIAAAVEPVLAANPSLKLKVKLNGIGPAVVQLAGHSTGDMYSVAASLLLSPARSVMVSCQDPGYTHPRPARDANLKAYDRSDTISQFIRQTLPENEGWRVMRAPVRGMKESSEQERLRRMAPGIPVSLQQNMAQVAQAWSPGYCARLRLQWGVRQGGNDPEQPYDKPLARWLSLHGLGKDDLAGKKIIVLWSRFSGKKGDLHPEHDTSFLGMRQLAGLARQLADVVIITGDKPLTEGLEGRQLRRRKNKYKGLESQCGVPAAATRGKVADLTEFWREQTTGTWSAQGNHAQQFRLYDYLHRVGEVKHLGMRSGVLLAMALLGYNTYYMEEQDSVGSKRMARFERRLSSLSLIRIQAPPTRTGKAIKDLLHKHWDSLSRTSGRCLSELAGAGTSPSYLSNIKYTPAAAARGLRLELVDPKAGQFAERSDLKEKPDVSGYTRGFTKSDLASINRFLMW